MDIGHGVTAVLALISLASVALALGLLVRGAWYRPRGAMPLVVAERHDHTPELFTLVLRRRGWRCFLPLPAYRAGQAVTLRVPGNSIHRKYSLARWQRIAFAYRVTIRREADGRFSPLLHRVAQRGAVLNVGRPKGDFGLTAHPAPRRAVLIAGGVGVTPLIAMRDAITAGRTKAKSVTLFWQMRHSAEAQCVPSLHDGLAVLANQAADGGRTHTSPPAVVETFVSRPESGEGTRLSADVMLQRLGSFEDCEFYLCASASFMSSCIDGLRARGVAPERIHFERFGIVGDAHEAGDIAVTVHGESAPFGPARSLLDCLEARNVVLSSDCRTGTCGQCAVRVVAGSTRYLVKPESECPSGYVLACCAVPATAVVLAT